MIKGLGSAAVMCELYTLAPDLVRYVEQQSGVRVEGLAASANSFGCKIGSGIGSAAVIWALALCQYNANAVSISAKYGRQFQCPVLVDPGSAQCSPAVLASIPKWDIEEQMTKKSGEAE
jgi:Na+/melibiose symporter-like transporter